MKKLFFLPALAAMMFSSCSSDEPTVDNPADQAGDKYMAFSITNLGGSRAADGYEDAAGTEGEVNDLYFLFFDRNGNAFMLEGRTVTGEVKNTNMVQPTSIETKKDAQGNEVMTGTLVLGKASPDSPFLGQTPAQVLCVANPSTDAMKELGGKNLNTVLTITTNAPDWATGKRFLMTNSTYVDATGAVKTTTSTEGYIKESVTAAEASPVVINIERAAAKVRVTYGNDFIVNNIETTPASQTFEVNGAATTLHVQVYGWRLMNYATFGYGFKQLSATYPAFTTDWWKDATNMRSYWANSLADATVSNIAYTLDATNKDDFTLKSFATANPLENIAYCYENTLHQDVTATNRTEGATAFVVKAVVGTMDASNNFTAIDMVKYAGKLYTVAHFKQMITDQFKSGHPNATVNSVNFVVDDATKNTWKATVTYNTNQTLDMSYIYNNFLWWNNGVTSYWQNIEHLAEGVFGVVRNHIYDYNVTAFNGLGIPGDNPGKPEDKESYMAAALRVLNWRVVSHNVTLE